MTKNAGEIAIEYYDRFNAAMNGDPTPPAHELFAPDFSFEAPGGPPVGCRYVGVEEVAREAMGLLARRLKFAPGFGCFVERVIVEDNRAVVLARARAESAEGRPYCGNYFVLFEVKDGVIVREVEILDTSVFMDCVHDMQLVTG